MHTDRKGCLNASPFLFVCFFTNTQMYRKKNKKKHLVKKTTNQQDYKGMLKSSQPNSLPKT